MKATKVFFLIVIVSTTSVYGQSTILQVINTSGGSSQNNGLFVEWGIGELALVNQMNSADGNSILTNGFIQPLPKDNIPLNIIGFRSPDIRIYPNPTHDLLEIDFSQNNYRKIIVQLSNELGNIVYTREIPVYGSGFVEKINMKGFTNGTYIVYIKKLNPVSGQYDLETESYTIIKL